MNLTVILLIAGVLFVLVVIVGVISVSLRQNSQEDEDPLQARLAEYLQAGDVASLAVVGEHPPFNVGIDGRRQHPRDRVSLD